ncbi:MAG: autotransporter assembly complex family protein [Pseudomonadota bacterium]
MLTASARAVFAGALFASGLPVWLLGVGLAGPAFGQALLEPGDEAAQGLVYEAALEDLEDETLADTLTASSLLLARQDEPPDDASGLLRRGRGDRERLSKVLRAFGYYDGSVAVTLDGTDLESADARAKISQMSGESIALTIAVEPGEQYVIGDVAVDWANDQPEDLTDLSEIMELAEGQPAKATEIYAARDRLVGHLRDIGYPLVTADSPDAVIDRAGRTMDIRFPIDPGRRATFGKVSYVGNTGVDTALLERSQPIEVGDPYSPQDLADLRGELSSLGVFSAVRVREGEALDDEGRLPITVEVSERKRRFIGFGARFASDEGFGLDAEWGHRNLFGQAEQLTATASVDRIGGAVGSGIDYSLGLGFSKPAFLRGDQRLFANVGALQESPDAFERTAVVSELGVERRLSPILSASLAGSLEISEVTEEGDTNEFFLLGLPATLRLDTTNDLLDPVSGWRGTVEATPYLDLQAENAPFLRFSSSIARYFDVFGNGRSVLAGRIGFGATLSESARDLPADKRFFSGGGGSVRGFEFQTLGPLNSEGDPRGGSSVLEAGLEWRQRIGENWGGVVFLDGGSAFTTVLPSNFRDLRYAAGFGVRYFTPIGPIRADIGFPLDREGDEGAFQFYIGLGQAF